MVCAAKTCVSYDENVNYVFCNLLLRQELYKSSRNNSYKSSKDKNYKISRDNSYKSPRVTSSDGIRGPV
jgi:hypothetical protein